MAEIERTIGEMSHDYVSFDRIAHLTLGHFHSNIALFHMTMSR
jgi:hypothetical protein